MTEETPAAVETDGNDTAAVMAALAGDKTYLKDPAETPEPSEAKDPEAPPGDDAAAAAAEGEADKAKPKKTAQERIDEITAQKHEVAREKDREIEFWKAKALQAPQSPPAQAAQDTPQGDGKPNRADYESEDDYIEDLTDWKAEQAVARHLDQRSKTDHVRTTLQTFETRAKTLFPDGEPAGLKAFKAIPVLSEAVQEIVGASDIGPKLAEYLGDNQAELTRLSSLSEAMQARELTLIESRLATPPKPTPKTATDAPEPPPQARGAGGQFKVAADTDDFAAFERQHMPGR